MTKTTKSQLKPCEHGCGKSHYSWAAREECRRKHSKPACTCPPYWRERGWDHSFTYGCPIAG